jgi:uncharacterized membrane protein YeaQ/YmgE (transglycosylase-associated protein family)
MYIEYWIFFGILVSIFASTFDLPLRFSRLFYGTVLAVIGSLVGGVAAYFIYGMRINGIDMSAIFITGLGAVLLILLGKRIESTFKVLKGGEKHAEWSI